MSAKKGFTLTELLVVMAIIAVLSAIAFPAMRLAIRRAESVNCIANMKNVLQATQLYATDYDDYLMLSRYGIESGASQTSDDSTWVQITLPYMRNFDVFRCPADKSARPKGTQPVDGDIIPGETYSRYYEASMRTNVGYNYLYLSPLYRGRSGNFLPYARTTTSIGNPGRTLYFVDSAWDLDRTGRPVGGGSYLVQPPCRYMRKNGQLSDTFPLGDDTELYYINDGWTKSNAGQFTSLGGAYPWHNGRSNVGMADGSVSTLTVNQLVAGCNVSDLGGLIFDDASYVWDTN